MKKFFNILKANKLRTILLILAGFIALFFGRNVFLVYIISVFANLSTLVIFSFFTKEKQ